MDSEYEAAQPTSIRYDMTLIFWEVVSLGGKTGVAGWLSSSEVDQHQPFRN